MLIYLGEFMNISTIIVLIIIAAAFMFAVIKSIKGAGSCSCGCGCCSANCKACSNKTQGLA